MIEIAVSVALAGWIVWSAHTAISLVEAHRRIELLRKASNLLHERLSRIEQMPIITDIDTGESVPLSEFASRD